MLAEAFTRLQRVLVLFGLEYDSHLATFKSDTISIRVDHQK